MTISGNTASANNVGIFASGPSTVSNNTAFSNGQYGFDIESGAVATGNVAYKQTATNAAGMYVSGGELRSNTIYGNYNGISSSNAAAFIDRNKIYSNTNFGINMANAGSPTIFDNLVYANSGPAISLNSTSGTGYIIGNTVFRKDGRRGSVDQRASIYVYNNILWTATGYDVEARFGEPGYLQCRLQRSVHDRRRQGWILEQRPQTTLANWQSTSGKDPNSKSADPQFVDIDGSDNLLGYSSANGGVNSGGDDDFYLSANSPAIDDAASWSSLATDIEGTVRHDDPATANTGTPNYTAADTGTNSFAAVGGRAILANPSRRRSTSRCRSAFRSMTARTQTS